MKMDNRDSLVISPTKQVEGLSEASTKQLPVPFIRKFHLFKNLPPELLS